MLLVDFWNVDGGRLAYWDSGSGPPLVFIHGVATTGQLWAEDLEPLADQYRLIVYERRGYGSSSESPRSWAAHRDDAIALIEGLDAKPAILVGYSAGASVALDLVLHRPELVSQLALVDSAFNLKRAITPEFVAALIKARLLRKLRGDQRGAEAWVRYIGSYSTGGTAFDRATPERRSLLLANASGIFADSDSGLPTIDESRLSTIRVPITLIEAAKSPPFLRKACFRLRKLLPHARLFTIGNAGHHITVDARDELLTLLRGLEARQPASVAAPP